MQPISPPADDDAALEAAVARVRAAADEFARLDLFSRRALIAELRTGLAACATRMVETGCAAKGLAADGPAAGEEWTSGPWPIARQMRLLDASLAALAHGAQPPIAGYRDAADGRLHVRVQPLDVFDRLGMPGVMAEVRLLPDVDRAGCAALRGAYYKTTSRRTGRVALVLGAGNVSAIPAQDVLTKLFNDGAVCVLKMNPVNAWLGPILAHAFAALITRGYLAIVHGGADTGAWLATHPAIDEIHVTGSAHTYDAIVWGDTPAAQRANRLAGAPRNPKPVSAELGNILPVLLVPGPYTARELAWQARDVAGYVVGNASFWCTAAKMLVLPRGAPAADEFMRHLTAVFARTPPRKAYYPGAHERWTRLCAGQPRVEQFGRAAADELPWTLIRDLDPDVDQPLYREEPFCSLLSQTSVGSSDPLEYLDAAVRFANERLWGTLTATVIVAPRAMRDPVIARAVDDALARLRYGTVGVNVFPGLSFALGSTPWGAWPGATREDIQSGCGFVHNTSMLAEMQIEKTIVRAPLTLPLAQPYHPGHRSADRIGCSLFELETTRRWSTLPGLFRAALAG